MKWLPLLLFALPSCLSAQKLRVRGETELESLSSGQLPQASHVRSSEDEHDLEAQDDARDLQAPTYDCVIIGAGWGGLGAAKKLQPENILVLEARNYVGGRSHTGTLSDRITRVEHGSNWIVGANEKNPVYKIAKRSGVGIVKSSLTLSYWSNVYGSHFPHQVSNNDIKSLVNKYQVAFYNHLEPRPDSSISDQPLREGANDYIDRKNIEGDNRLAFEMTLDSWIVQDYAASLEDLSHRHWDTGDWIRGQDVILNPVNKGYSGVIDYYAQSFRSKIQLKAVVTEIDYSTSNVKVTYVQNGATKTVTALHVIVAVPLGVLKQKTIKFVPDLPAEKKSAIDKLGMGLLNKCYLKWDGSDSLPWSTQNANWLEKIAPLGEQGKWTQFYNLEPTTGAKMLIAFTAGREAERVEQLTNESIQVEVMASLKTMFGDNIPDPKEIFVSRWRADPFAAGSYSYYEVGSEPQHRTDLAATVSGRLFFAGEATSLSNYATTHGALMTGEEAGKSVLDKLRRMRRLNGERETLSLAESEMVKNLRHKSSRQPVVD